ncbi:MAG: hypothetical protein IIZ39_15055, partial [Blautia sp.]|nr:hypothetical protein [Blautia sp.]
MEKKGAFRLLLWGAALGLGLTALGGSLAFANDFYSPSDTGGILMPESESSGYEEDMDEEIDEEDEEDWDDIIWDDEEDDVDFEDMDWDDDEDWDDEELMSDSEFELEGTEESVAGKVYVFDMKNHYAFSKSRKFYSTLTENVSFGQFSIAADFTDFSELDGIPLYEVGSGNVSFVYRYDDSRLKAEEDSWHLVKDQSRQVDNMKLRSNIKMGAIVVQMSKDQENWTTVHEVTNLFEDVPITNGPFYTTTQVQVLNGNYVRVIVLYELGVKKEEKAGSRRFAEVYEFYINSSYIPETDGDEYEFDAEAILANTGKGNGYSENRAIDKEDLHYGWSMGRFYVTGYTSVEEDGQGNITFMKKKKKSLCLWYEQEQDIHALNGSEYLFVAEDTKGYDLFFNATKQYFGKGALIVCLTDLYGVRGESQVTTNFLDSQAEQSMPTLIGAFSEEGDVEVALDYMLRDETPQVKDVNLLAREA